MAKLPGCARLLLATVWLALANVLTCSAANVDLSANDHIVRRDGLRFSVNGRPFVPVGVNNHYLTFGTSAEVEAVLDGAVALGATTIRTFLQPVIGDPKLPSSTIWDSKSRYEFEQSRNPWGLHAFMGQRSTEDGVQ